MRSIATFTTVSLWVLFSLGAASAQTSQPPQPAVIAAPASNQPLAYSEVFTGRVTAVQRIDLRARVSGFLTAIGFKEGNRVDAGAVLFEIEPDAYQAAVTQVEGQIASAEAEKKLADIDLARQQELVTKQVAAEVTLQQAEANVGNIEGQIQQLQGALQRAQLDLSYTKVVAPFAGRVGLTDYDVGAFVGPESGVLANLSSIDPVYVTFPVSEATLINVRNRLVGKDTKADLDSDDGTGFEAQITLANGDIYPEKGRIVIVDTEVQTGTDTIIVRAEFANPDGLLRDGQLVSIEIIEEAGETALTVPVKALQRDQTGYFVMTVDDTGKVAKTPIEVARISGMQVAIASGLNEGQQVITDGLQKVRPGMMVTVHTDDDTSTDAQAGAQTGAE